MDEASRSRQFSKMLWRQWNLYFISGKHSSEREATKANDEGNAGMGKDTAGGYRGQDKDID